MVFRTSSVFLVLALLGSPSATAHPPDPMLVIGGNCPNPLTLRVNHATPGGKVAIALADGPGLTTIHTRVCGAVTLDLAGDVRLQGTFVAADNGSGMVHIDVPAHRCGAWVQALDLTTCKVTDAEPVAITPNGP